MHVVAKKSDPPAHNKSVAPQVSAFASSGSELVCEAFEAADKDGSGTLDADELQLVIETLPISITVEEVEREIGAGTNRNDDGKLSIDLETLTAWWKTHESGPRGELTASGCAGPRGLGHTNLVYTNRRRNVTHQPGHYTRS